MSKKVPLAAPIIGRDAEFRVLDAANRAVLMRAFQLTSDELEILPGSFSASAIEIASAPMSFKASFDIRVENDNFLRKMMGLPPEFHLPPRKPSCAWIDEDE